MYIGCHISISKGYYNAGKMAKDIGANTFQFFTRNPRGGKAKELDKEDINKLSELMESEKFGPILAHAPYTLNMASYKENVWEFAKVTLEEDLKRLESMPCSLYNFHPGSHTGKGIEYGINRITTLLNSVLTGNENVMLLLETMSGQGTEVGSNFWELSKIIANTKNSELMGVCLDTAHVYSAGYDIVNNLDDVLKEFDKIIGIERLKAIHLNDSMMEFNARKDRHAKIGEGSIGLEAIKQIVNHKQLKDIPFLLETPNELEGHKKEIEILRG